MMSIEKKFQGVSSAIALGTLWAATALGAPIPIKETVSQQDIVGVASASKDHTTLVKALQAGDRVEVLQKPGPYTVFAPTNSAFNKLPPGTLDGLLKPENKEKLQSVLEYHVSVGVYNPKDLKDGMVLSEVNGDKATIRVKGGKTYINDAALLQAIRTANGIVYVIDGVLQPPPEKKG